MVVNPFFLHGSTQEQNLMQDLVNEQIKMYGIDVYYIPREFVREATILREVTSSEFRSYFIIEAYLDSYDGYGGQGDYLSKFGIQVRDDCTFTISRERYENYIAPFLNSRMIFLMDSLTANNDLPVVHRPREGDLVYFPYGRRLFEIKFVEHEKPFYQLGKGYTYELQCELFEYEDEVLDTSIDEVDSTIQNEGYITTLDLIPLRNRAEVTVGVGSGYISELTLFDEGTGYSAPPEIRITPPEIGQDPNVVALITVPNNNYDSGAISNLLVFNSGSGYKEAPRVEAVGDGRGAVIRAGINSESLGIVDFTITNQGAGYPEDVPIIVYNNANDIIGEGLALTDGKKIVKTIVTNPGKDINRGSVRAIVNAPAVEGTGNFIYNEIVVGKSSGTKARVRGWDEPAKQLAITNLNPEEKEVFFTPGEIIEGETSGARFAVSRYDDTNPRDAYAQNDEIDEEAKDIVDSSEFNQFDPFDEF